MMRETVETTYADLRPDDLVIDKSGRAWPIAELRENFTGQQPASPSFWLCDPVTKVKLHHVVKLSTDPVTVSRVPDESPVLTDPDPVAEELAGGSTETEALAKFPDFHATMEEAVAAVEEIGGEVPHPTSMDAVEAVQSGLIGESEVVVEYTEKEFAAAEAATDDSPVQLPAFEDMTILEMRSHLYLLHGVYAHDMKSRVDTIAMHIQAHADHEAGKLASRHVPHVHGVK